MNFIVRVLRRLKRLLLGTPQLPLANALQFEALYLSAVGLPQIKSGMGVVFSMDRALQLHSLLSSYFEKVKDPVPLHVIYRATSDAHHEAYAQVFEIFKASKIFPIRQQSKEVFRKIVLDLLGKSRADWVFFLVDDIIFIDDVRLSDFSRYDLRDFVPSLRLGKHLTRCFTMNQEQVLPSWLSDSRLKEGHVSWSWSEGSCDWGYPISVDGHFFNRAEFLEMSKQTDFSSPNTFEGNLQKFGPYFKKRQGVCFDRSKIVNLAINKVQTDNSNLHGDLHQDDLLKVWNDGKRMDFHRFYGVLNESAHIDTPIHFTERK